MGKMTEVRRARTLAAQVWGALAALAAIHLCEPAFAQTRWASQTGYAVTLSAGWSWESTEGSIAHFRTAASSVAFCYGYSRAIPDDARLTQDILNANIEQSSVQMGHWRAITGVHRKLSDNFETPHMSTAQKNGVQVLTFDNLWTNAKGRDFKFRGAVARQPNLSTNFWCIYDPTPSMDANVSAMIGSFTPIR